MMRRAQPAGFTLIETMISLAMAGLVVATAVVTYNAAQRQTKNQKGEWLAFTIAQQQLEMFGSMPSEAPVLADSQADGVSDTLFGTPADADCSVGVDGGLTGDYKVNELGRADPSGLYRLCWKITDGSPQGTLKNIRVIAGYPTISAALTEGNATVQGMDYVILQLIR